MHFPAYYELVPNTSNSFNKNEVYSQQVSGELELLCRRCYIVMVETLTCLGAGQSGSAGAAYRGRGGRPHRPGDRSVRRLSARLRESPPQHPPQGRGALVVVDKVSMDSYAS